MTSPLWQYNMVGQLTAPPYQSVYWLVFNAPDTTGAQSGYFGQLQNIAVVSSQQVTYPSNATPTLDANSIAGIQVGGGTPIRRQGLVFIQSDSGYIPTESSLATYNPIDYGAKGDGVSDDSGAINNCITAANAIGADVMLPFGTFLCRSNINVPTAQVIRGQGYNSQLIFKGSASLRLNNVTDVRLSNFAVRSLDTGGGASPYGMHITSSYYVTVQKIWIRSGTGAFATCGLLIDAVAGVGLGNNAQLNFYDVDIQACSGDGVRFQDDLFQSVNFIHCNISSNAGFGLNQLQVTDTSSISQLMMSNCLVEGNTIGDINAQSMGGSFFRGCHFEQAIGSLVPNVILGDLVTNGRFRGVTFHGCFFNGGSAPILVSVPRNTGNNQGLTFIGCSFFNDVGSSGTTPAPVALGIAGVAGLDVINCYIGKGAEQMSMFNLTDGNCTGVRVTWLDTYAVINFIADADIDLTVVGGYPGTLPGGHNRGQDCFYPSDVLHFTGTLDSPFSVKVPIGTRWQKTFINDAAQSITIKGNSGTGIVIANGKTAILRSDGTNVLRVTADT